MESGCQCPAPEDVDRAVVAAVVDELNAVDRQPRPVVGSEIEVISSGQGDIDGSGPDRDEIVLSQSLRKGEVVVAEVQDRLDPSHDGRSHVGDLALEEGLAGLTRGVHLVVRGGQAPAADDAGVVERARLDPVTSYEGREMRGRS